jgi:hypothetical protein
MNLTEGPMLRKLIVYAAFLILFRRLKMHQADKKTV